MSSGTERSEEGEEAEVWGVREMRRLAAGVEGAPGGLVEGARVFSVGGAGVTGTSCLLLRGEAEVTVLAERRRAAVSVNGVVVFMLVVVSWNERL